LTSEAAARLAAAAAEARARDAAGADARVGACELEALRAREAAERAAARLSSLEVPRTERRLVRKGVLLLITTTINGRIGSRRSRRSDR